MHARLHLRPALLALAAACCLGASACGDEGAPRDRTRGADGAPAQRAPAGDAAPDATAPDDRGAATGATPVDRVRAARQVLAAAIASERAPRRFSTSIELAIPGAPEVEIELEGSGRRGATSTTAIPHGLAALVADRRRVAVVADRLLVAAPARDDGPSTWTDVGSASGVQLDLGRELLTHPMLTEVARAERRSDGRLVVHLRVPAGPLREYAQAERSGPVSELLARARSLTVLVEIERGRIVHDEFRLAVELVRPSTPPVRIGGITRTTYPDRGGGVPEVDVPGPRDVVRPGEVADVLPQLGALTADQ